MRGVKSSMPRVVIDPNVLVSAAITPAGETARLVPALERGDYELIASALLLAELGGVLGRGKFRRYLTDEQAGGFVAMIRDNAVIVQDSALGARLSEDPKDEYLIALVAAARADALVSGDPHLTRLRGTIPVMTPREFLDSLAAGGAA